MFLHTTGLTSMILLSIIGPILFYLSKKNKNVDPEKKVFVFASMREAMTVFGLAFILLLVLT